MSAPVPSVPVDRPSPFPVRETIAAIALAGAAGLGIVVAPLPIVVLVAGLVYVCVASRLAVPLFAASLFLVIYDPSSLEGVGFIARPEIQKGAVLLALVPLLISRGVSARLSLVAPAYAVAALLTILSGHTIAGLGATQTVSTFITLTTGWIALSVRWRWPSDWWLLKIICLIPLACVAFGVVLQAAGLHELVQAASGNDPISRLRGATIAAQLGLMAFIATVVSGICWRAARWRWARPLFVLNVLILAATVSRGAAIALGIAMVWPALRYVRGRSASTPGTAFFRLLFAAFIVVLVVSVLVPRLQERNSGSTTYNGQTTVTADDSSGRDTAWKEYYAIAKRSPVFGHGLGSSPLTKIDQPGFSVQHNEYLRLLLENGYLGGILILLAIILTVGRAIARAPRWLRGDLIGAAIALAAYSFTDNTLTSLPLVLPFCLLLGICASAGSLRMPRAARVVVVDPSEASRSTQLATA